MEQVFSLWEKASGLEFVNAGENSLEADIEISFASYEHGDGDAFDGPGGTLAHAYFPQFGGDVHMDDSERWTVDSYQGTNLLQTLTHEIGHSLGLSHSDVRDSVMAPFYQGIDQSEHNITRYLTVLTNQNTALHVISFTVLTNKDTASHVMSLY